MVMLSFVFVCFPPVCVERSFFFLVQSKIILSFYLFAGCCHLLLAVSLESVVCLLGGHFFNFPIYETSVYVTKKGCVISL